MIFKSGLIVGTEVTDFFFHCLDLEVSINDVVWRNEPENLYLPQVWSFLHLEDCYGGTNQGASAIILSVLDRNLSRISIFELLVDPQSCIPYVQMGLMMVL